MKYATSCEACCARGNLSYISINKNTPTTLNSLENFVHTLYSMPISSQGRGHNAGDRATMHEAKLKIPSRLANQ